jgi:hypothetical protein
VPDKLHKLTVPSTHFHTKLNGLQQLAYLLVTMSEILSNTVILEMGFKNEKLQEFYVSQQEIVALLSPIICTFHTTVLVVQHPIFAMLITHPQKNKIFSTHPINMDSSNVYKPLKHFTLINKWFMADTTELWTLITM